MTLLQEIVQLLEAKEKEAIQPNELDRIASPMKLPLQLSKEGKEIGGKTSTRIEKITVKGSNNGKIYGRRSIAQKST